MMKTFTFLAATVVLFATETFAQSNGTEEKYCGYTAVNGLTSQRNNQKCGALLDDAFLPYNAMYNGTVTLALTGNPSKCPQNTYNMAGYTAAIGPQKIAGNDTFTRAGYDKNPFYFWWKYKENKYISAGFLSSSDYFVTEAQWWTLNSTKNGNGFDIGGSYTGKLAPYSNIFNYPTDEKGCWKVNIYNHIASARTDSATNYNYWTLTGRVEPEKIHMVLDQTIMSNGVEYHSVFTYDGTAAPTDKLPARLVTMENVPTTDAALRGNWNVTAVQEQEKAKAKNATGSNSGAERLGGQNSWTMLAGVVGTLGAAFAML